MTTAKYLFIAIPVHPAIRHAIAEWKQTWQDPPVRWMDEQDLHVTLVPPWLESNPEECIDRLNRFVPPSFAHTIQFNRIRFGPTPRNPRLIWAEGPNASETLYIKQTIERWMSRPRDPRPFRTHLTLARFDPKIFSSFATQKLNKPVDWRQPIDRVALYESIRQESGVNYRILAEKRFPENTTS